MYKRILEEPDILVDYYNDGKPVIRISLFKDGHYSDQYFVDIPEVNTEGTTTIECTTH